MLAHLPTFGLVALQSKELSEFISDSTLEQYREQHKKRSTASRPAALTSTTLEAMREVVKEFYAAIPPGKCANCGAFSPAIKKQGHTKLFKVWIQKYVWQQQHMYKMLLLLMRRSPPSWTAGVDIQSKCCAEPGPRFEDQRSLG